MLTTHGSTIIAEWQQDNPQNTTPRGYSTAKAAANLGVLPQTLRAGYCRNGHYYNVIPVKRLNRFLVWPADEIDRLAMGQEVRP